MQEENNVQAVQIVSNGRRKLLINPKFQITFMAYMVGMSGVAIAIFYCANIYFFWKFNQTGQSLGLPVDHVFFQFLNDQKSTMNIIFAVTSLAAFGALALGGLLLSHRVSGPLYRLARHMAEVADGKTIADVNFRKKDFFPEIAEGYNRQLKLYRDATSKDDKAA